MNKWFVVVAILLSLAVMQVSNKSLSVDIYPGKYVPVIDIKYGKD